MKTPSDVLLATLKAFFRYLLFAAATWLIKKGFVDAETLSPENIGILASGAAVGIATLAWTFYNKSKVHDLLVRAAAAPAGTKIEDLKKE